MKSITVALLGRLKELAESAGKSLFERAGLALEILDDADWIAEAHNGSRRCAEQELADEYFSDVAMTGWFERLLVLRRHYPDAATWEKDRFNPQRLWIRYEEEQKQQRPTPAAPKKQSVPLHIHEEAQEELQSTKRQLQQKDEQIAELQRSRHGHAEAWDDGEWPAVTKKPKPSHRTQSHNERSVSENPVLSAKVATARDLAEMIAEMIQSHPEPEQVWELVCNQLPFAELAHAG